MCEVIQYLAAANVLRDYVVDNGPQPEFKSPSIGVMAVAAIIAGGLIQSYPQLLNDVIFAPVAPDSDESCVVLVVTPMAAPEPNPSVNLFPYLGSAISVLLDDGTVVKAGSVPMSAKPGKAADNEDDGVLFIAAAELQEAIDRGITFVTGWLAGLPGVFESTVRENFVIEITVNANNRRLAEVLVEMTTALEKLTAVR